MPIKSYRDYAKETDMYRLCCDTCSHSGPTHSDLDRVFKMAYKAGWIKTLGVKASDPATWSCSVCKATKDRLME